VDQGVGYAEEEAYESSLPVLWNRQLDLADPAFFGGIAVARDGTLYSVSEQTVRRRVRQTKRFLVMLASVILIGLVGLTYWKGLWSWPGGSEGSALPCPTATPVAAPMEGTQVNVYNGTDKAGLANTVAGKLQKRGFVVPEIGNDPLRETVGGAAVIRHSSSTLLMAKTVAAQVKGKVTLVVDETRLENNVDLVLGNKFTGLRSVKEVTPMLQPKPAPSPEGCRPVETAPSV